MEFTSESRPNHSTSILERISKRGEANDSKTEGTFDDGTIVATPEPADSIIGKQELDLENSIPQNAEDIKSPVKIPDGGWKAWLTVFGAWCLLFPTYGTTYASDVYQDLYIRSYLPSYSPSTIGWIASTQLFVNFSMGFLVGKALDAGYFYHTVSLATLLYIISYFMLSLAQQDAFYQIFLSQGVAAGIALGCICLSAVNVVTHHFNERRGFAIGIVLSGCSCGGVVIPILLNKFIAKEGFAQATRNVAYLSTGMIVLAILLMRIRLPPPSKAKEVQSSLSPIPPLTIKDLVMDTRYMLAIAGVFFGVVGLLTPTCFLQLYAVVHSVDQDLTSYIIAILNGAAIIGRIFPSFLSDIWGPFNVILVCTYTCVALMFAMLAATNPGGIIFIAILYGFFSGAYISLSNPLFLNMVNSLGETGTRLGFAYSIIAFAALIGTPIAGALLTRDLLWARPFCFSGACLILGFGCLFASRHLTARQKGTWKV
ncbi:hypothetical protein M408DRAFT_317476 [Serendipita vermifera MAFF 305830]|uniref:Major facilitator superfamily (MFS) profile domain-containing protein n=1 Tax=Serendipita vermifera MAFF 305830 TaxID=933852 RepID=A0A0C2WDD5_SERVB|nr:hypothetical protein M408DRAFT_317476 [Serendipita vermifera MAFF 305830]